MSNKQVKICIFILICIGVFYVSLISFFELNKLKINSCLLKSITGFPCVTCGTTRAFYLVLNGEIYKSLLMNPLGLVVFIGSVSFIFLLFFDYFVGSKILNNLIEKVKTLRLNNRIIILLFLLLLLNWIWNVIKMN